MKRIAAIIPARGGSKGIPNKNIINFCNRPLLAHTIHQASLSNYINNIYVSSNCDKILNVAIENGALPIKRPERHSTDDAPSESAIKHFLSLNSHYDIVVFLQATSPLRETKDIDMAIEKFINNKYDSLFSATNAEDSCVWLINDKGPQSVTYDYQNRKRRQEISNLLLENGSFYIFDSKGFQHSNNRLFGNIGFFVMDGWKKYEIDNFNDLEVCELIYKRRIKQWKE